MGCHQHFSFSWRFSAAEVQRLSSGSFSLAPARKAPPFGQRRCRLLGFWGTSGEEINEEMRWDGMLRWEPEKVCLVALACRLIHIFFVVHLQSGLELRNISDFTSLFFFCNPLLSPRSRLVFAGICWTCWPQEFGKIHQKWFGLGTAPPQLRWFYATQMVEICSRAPTSGQLIPAT